ncbi:dehydrogenase [Nocardia stercoris]|uniref:Dehydrogenase n=2 Tax=Nocardia stercoris TaxID=2483361 RepID=A0A3M2L2X1_9NOCA|nr:dehydrogenase [Nocardia stercoris]
MISVTEAIRTRRTVRHYRPDPVPAATLDTLLELAMEAPSSWNLQDRSIVVITDPAGRDGLTWATDGQPQPQEAPVMLVFVAETEAWQADRSDVYEAARRRGAWSEEFVTGFAAAATEFQQGLAAHGLLREYAVKDAMIAATYVMLAATELGLSTSPMNGWDEAKVKQVIGIEDRPDLAVALLMSVGYAAEQRIHPGRRAVDRTVFRDRYPAANP